MLDAYNRKIVAPNGKLFVIKVAKYKQRSILTSIQNTKSLLINCAKCQKGNISKGWLM
jgi:hypothetical protein